MFTLAWVAAVLPANAQTPTPVPTTGNWENPSDDMITGKKHAGSQLLDTIKNTINWLLWILATIAVAICLYAGFLMVTSAGDEKKYQKWLTILKYAAIGLAIVWLSWLIVSVIFWFIRLNWKDNVVQTWA